MATKQTCEECGAELPANAPQGLCPRCLAKMGLGLLPAEESPKSDIVIERTGTMIGRYKLLEKIGEGGFGVVFMAEQVEPVQRKVALKIIKAGMDTREVIARFEAERQAIALMDHPNIARALDAGATEAGRPYFVMELVRGIPITDYCDQRQLPTRERLQLFIKVCQAVQHAHQKGVIHRDIKPSNVLVTEHDGEPVPKVIDFGVAKALGQKLTAKTLFTAFHHLIGTPAYMSPEQAALSGLDIDTRADIYSLGVLLYELLTGVTPFDADTFRKAAMDEVRRVIRETEPPKPSTRLQTLGEKLTDVAKQRHTEPAALGRLIRGDLDWIVMKCLEKDRQRRYETANGLAADVARHLNSEPVVARAPSNLYRFQKLIHRNKLAFAATGAIGAVLVIGVAVSTWGTVRAMRAEREQAHFRRNAETEAAKATAISDFLQHLLRSANPDDLKGSDYTVRQLLDDFSVGLTNQLAGQPEVEATVRLTIARAYGRLGAADKAQTHLVRALALRRSVFGEKHEQVAEILVACAVAFFQQDQNPKGEGPVREALEIYRKRGIVGGPVVAALAVLQRILNSEERLAEAEVVTEKALAMARESPGIEFPEIASMIHGLAEIKLKRFHCAEAESLALRAVEMHRRLHGGGHPETAWALICLGQALKAQGKLTEAELASQEALTIFRKQYAYGHISVELAVSELKAILEVKGDSAGIEALARDRLADANKRIQRNDADAQAWLQRFLAEAELKEWKAAIKSCEQAIALFKRLAQEDPGNSDYPRHWGHSQCELAKLLRTSGEREQAEQNLREALQVFEQAARDFPTEPYFRQEQAFNHRLLADVLSELGRPDESERHYRTAIDLYAALAADVPQNLFYFHEVFHTTQSLAALLEQVGRPGAVDYQPAIALSEKANEARRKLPANEHLDLAAALCGMSFLLREQGSLSEAVSTAREALAIRKKLLGNEHADVAQSLHLLAWNLNLVGKHAEAEALSLEEVAMWRKLLGNEHDKVAWALGDLTIFLRDQGKLPQAETAIRESLAIRQKRLGNSHSETVNSLNLLVELRRAQGKDAEAGALEREALENSKSP